MYKLDRIDLEILSHLANNARLTNKDLAKKIGVVPSTCLERVRTLKAKGILKGFHAEIDIAELGITLHAMVAIRLEVHSRQILDAFYRYAANLTEVTGIYHLSGANDFLIKVSVSDTHKLKDFVLDAFAERPEVAHIETSLIYDQINKYSIPCDPDVLSNE